jgi:TfoX/Sxy family transcriptional regulator of competence genes
MVYRPVRYELIMKVAEAYDVRARRMFNGMGIYTGEKMFAFLYESEIGLKLSPQDQEEALCLPGAEPLRPDPEQEPMREYVKMPADVLENFDKFTQWVERSTAYVRNKSNGQH